MLRTGTGTGHGHDPSLDILPHYGGNLQDLKVISYDPQNVAPV